jgi:hypothetical protein
MAKSIVVICPTTQRDMRATNWHDGQITRTPRRCERSEAIQSQGKTFRAALDRFVALLLAMKV